MWPKLAVSGEAVPEQVRNCYSEAIAVRKRSLNSFATNIRRALEAVCEDRGIVKTPLSKSLQKLAFSDQLAPRLNEITDVLRFVGNVGAHNDRGVTQGEAEVIDNCFRLLVEYFCEVPDQIRRLRRIVADVAENQLEEAGDSASKPPETGKLQ